MKHKTQDYKISAVKYYLKENKSLDEVSDIFSCKKQSLFKWVNTYKKDKSIKRYSRKPVSYQ
jgi:transposase-like protein